jgi:uncharacterized protein YcaQ
MAHEASIVPVETWPLLWNRMETYRVRPYGFEKFMARRPGYVERVVAEVGARCPLAADDLADPEDVPRKMAGDAWIGTVPRAVLEAHFGRGMLAVTERRSNFARVFDLAERVLPSQHHGRRVDREEAQREIGQIVGGGDAAGARGQAQQRELTSTGRHGCPGTLRPRPCCRRSIL